MSSGSVLVDKPRNTFRLHLLQPQIADRWPIAAACVTTNCLGEGRSVVVFQ
jgi:hypothetical protein